MCVDCSRDTLWKKLVKMDFTRYFLESAKVATELTGRKKVETELEPLFALYVSDMLTSDMSKDLDYVYLSRNLHVHFLILTRYYLLNRII